jgi:hypothetical protein
MTDFDDADSIKLSLQSGPECVCVFLNVYAINYEDTYMRRKNTGRETKTENAS